MIPHTPSSTLFPYTTLFRSGLVQSSTLMKPFLTIGSGTPSTMSYHQVGWPIGYSNAMKLCGSVAHTCTKAASRSEEHTSELQSRGHLVCRLLLEKKKNYNQY